jgi:hypothetical protein
MATRPNLPVVTPGATQLVVDGAPLAQLAAGTRCFVRVTQSDGAGTPFSDATAPVVVVGPRLAPAPTLPIASKLEPAAASLASARRAPAVTVGEMAPGIRFLYVAGGDGGALAGARSDVEAFPISLTGLGTGKILSRAPLPSAITHAGLVAAGRWLFLVGGHDGTKSLATVSRAEVLDPAEAPIISEIAPELPTGTRSIAAGRWFYQVAVRFADNDPYNPGGESLPGPLQAVELPPIPGGLSVTVRWTGGATSGSTMPPRVIAGYRLYRGARADAIVAAIDLPSSALSFLDDDSAAWVTTVPHAFGALGRFTQTGVPQLTTPRAGAGVAAAPDVTTPGRWFLYAGFGWNSTASPALPTSYEVLQVDVSSLGTDFGSANAFTENALPGASGRWLLGAHAATARDHATVGSDSYVYFGQGISNLSLMGISNPDVVAETSVGRINAGGGGALTNRSNNLATLTVDYGYGVFALGDNLLYLGGATSTSTPNASSFGTAIMRGSAPTLGAWLETGVPLVEGRFLPGVAGDGGLLWVVGGSGADLFSSSQTILEGKL